MVQKEIVNPHWKSVPACMVWPDPSNDETGIREIMKGKRSLKSVEKLRVQLKDPQSALKLMFTNLDTNADRLITRNELRKAINFGMVYPNHISDSDFNELLLILDPMHSNVIKCEDFLNLMKTNDHMNIGERIKDVSIHSRERAEPVSLLQIDNQLRECLKSHTQTRQMLKAFASYDLENSGKVKKPHVKYIIQKYCFPLSNPQFEALWKIFPLCGLNELKYFEFLEEYGNMENDTSNGTELLSLKLQQPSLQRNKEWIGECKAAATPVHTDPHFNMPDKLEDRRRYKTSSTWTLAPDNSEFDILFKKLMEKNWHEILHRCRQTDPRRTGRISAESIKEIMSQCRIPVNNKSVTDLLEMKYGIVQGTELNYWSLIRKIISQTNGFISESSLPEDLARRDALDEWHRQYEMFLKQIKILEPPEIQYYEKEKPNYLAIPAEAAWSKLPAPPDYNLLLKELVDRSWREILRRCRMVDTKRSGNIQAEEFYTILAKCGIPLQNRNISKIIQNVYRITHGSKANYWLFLRKCTLDDSKKCDDGTLKSDSSHIYRILLRMRTQILFIFRALRQKFLANDPHKTGLIEAIKFRKILNEFAIVLKDEHFFIFMKHFDPVLTGCIPYVNFLQSFAHPNFV